MSLGAEIASALPYLRAEAESLQTDACTVTRTDRSGDGTFDADTGLTTFPTSTILTDQACRLRMVNINERQIVAGEHNFVLQYAVLSVPVGAALLAVDDSVTITASTDPLIVGQRFDVIALHLASQISARRYQLRIAAA